MSVYECLACGGLVARLPQILPRLRRDRLRGIRLARLRLLTRPAGSITLAGSAVDAMLKEMGLKEGRLYERIHDAVRCRST